MVHGDSMQMKRLKHALTDKYTEAKRQIQIYTPQNCETVEFEFKGDKLAKVLQIMLQYSLADSPRPLVLWQKLLHRLGAYWKVC